MPGRVCTCTMVMYKVGWDETGKKILDRVGFRISSCVRIGRLWSACAVLLQKLLPNILYTVPCSKLYCKFDIDQNTASTQRGN